MSKSRSGSLVLLLLLIAGIIGLAIYTLKLKSRHEDLHQVHKELQQEFDNQIIVIDSLNATNKDLHQQLTDEKAKINDYKKRITALLSKNKLSAKEIVKLGKQIGSLEDEIAAYRSRIDELEEQVKSLQASNDALDKKNNVLSKERDMLEQKVNQAAQIRAINLSMVSTKEVWFFGKKRKPSIDPAKISEITITFFLQNNFLAQNGTQEIYVSIIQPDGSVLVDKELQSGSVSFGGLEQVRYTQKIVTNYDKKLVNKVTTLFSPDQSPMQAGKYEVLVYDNTGTIISDRASFFFDLVAKR